MNDAQGYTAKPKRIATSRNYLKTYECRADNLFVYDNNREPFQIRRMGNGNKRFLASRINSQQIT